MRSSKTVCVRRARPLLGTFVIVTVRGQGRMLEGATEKAFQAVERVHRLMSAHDPESDLGRMVRQPSYEPLEVDPWTHEVLTLSRRISILSGGLFDATVGARLERAGFLPEWESPFGDGTASTYQDLDLLPGDRVLLRRPCRLDLGGIAKGFAVDKAVEAAASVPGVRDVVLNAGGDLRIQAGRPQELWLRDPFHPELFWKGGMVREGSFASSGGKVSERESARGPAVPLLGPGQSDAPTVTPGILVAAESCAVADALTKVAALAPEAVAARVAEDLRAKAFIAVDKMGYRELGRS